MNVLRLSADGKELKKNNKKKKCNLLFIDFKSAFDYVDHSILFRRLKEKNYPKYWINTIKSLY